jgi:type VI secretion system protein ImpL
MNDLLRRLPWMPWVAGFLVIATLLLTVGRKIGMSWLVVLFVLLILGLIVAIVLLVRQLKQAAAADEIERTISTQADADIERSTPGQLAEMQQLKEELLAAIEQLKSSSKRTGSDALATLPWYMLIGPAGAGKSELVKRSGLEFPLRERSGDPRAVRGVGGTRGFSWWLANEAVLLDMAGKTLATAAFDDSGDWVSFLQTLRKQRPEKPIHGVIVVVAVDQLADQPEARIDSVARSARERLQELVQHLGVVFPVYVVFNRVDRMAGFAEFFEDTTAGERQEPWGATLSLERSTANPADQLFEEELGIMMGALSERRLPRMSAMAEPSSRARAFAFPLQIERVRGNLRRFLRTLFEVQADAEPPLFRGFYFSAAAQDGESSDRVLQPAVRPLGLTIQPPESSPPAQRGAWFARDLFTEVVFPDAGLATTSRGAAGRLKRGETIMVGAWGLALLLMLCLFTGFSCSNGGVVGRARRASVEVANRVTDETALVDNLRTLDHLRVAADELDQIERHVPFGRRVGAWAGGVARDPAVRLWMRRTAQYVLKPAVVRMEDSLRARVAGTPGTFLEDFYRFRAWRMLTDPGKMDAEDATILAREVTGALADRLELGGTDAAGRRVYPELVRQQMEFLARNPKDLAAIVRDYLPEQDRTLVAQMAGIVHDEWKPAEFYAELSSGANANLKPLGFGDIAGSSPLMSGTVTVPGAFTQDGWTKEVQPRAAWYGRMIRRDALMVAAFGGRAPDLERDLLTFYAADVTKKWVEFLDGVQYTPQSSMDGIADQLARLAKGDSPLFKLLRGVRDQAKGLTVTGTPLEAVGRDFRILSDFFAPPGSLGQRTNDFLGDLARKLPGQGGAPSTSQQTMDARYMQYLGKAQGDVAKLGPAAPLNRLQDLLSPPPDQTNGVFELVSFAQTLGENFADSPSGPVIARLLRAPVDSAREIVRTRGLGPRVAAAWTGTVLTRFQAELGGKYPFSAGGRDASFDDFAACFGPTGYFWTFYTQHLAPFLNEDGSSKSGEAPPVSPGMIEFLRKAHAIRQAFFAAGPQPSLSFSASTTPPQRDAAILVRWVAIDCGGKTVTYAMGPPREESLSWPGEDPNADAGVRAQAAPPEDAKKKRKKGEPESIAVEPLTASGPWGFFRLLDRASDVSTSGGSTSVTWSLTAVNGAKIHTTWVLKAGSVDSPLARGFLRLNPPATP